MDIAKFIDHTFLKPTAIESDIKQLCAEAIEYGFAAVCVPPNFVQLASNLSKNTDLKVATVIGFPFGYNHISAKIEEIKQAIADGADELDMVINISDVKDNNWSKISKDIAMALLPVRLNNKILKVIIESGILSDDEIVYCCKICTKHKVDYVKTSTGYAEKGASKAAVMLMRANLPESIKIKAAGGIRDYENAKQLIEAGASRIGATSSLNILKGSKDIQL